MTESTDPFDHVPVCACDPGFGMGPSRQERLECRLRGGPCSPNYKPKPGDNHPAH